MVRAALLFALRPLILLRRTQRLVATRAAGTLSAREPCAARRRNAQHGNHPYGQEQSERIF